MGQLASAMGVTPGTATTMVKALNEAGLVRLRALHRRPAAAGGRAAGRAGDSPAPAGGALPGAGDGDELGRGARRGREARTRGLGAADRADGRDAGPPRSRSARRPDSQRRRRRHAARAAQPAHLPAGRAAVGDARGRSGRGVPALPRAEPPEAGTGARVESRDEAADSVRVRCKDAEPLTIGARAASKLLVEVLSVAVFVLALITSAGAAQPPSPAPQASAPSRSPSPTTRSSSKRPSTRKPRVFQNIVGVLLGEEGGAWGHHVHPGMARSVDEAPACRTRRRWSTSRTRPGWATRC